MFADFAARGRSGLNCRELNWTAPVKLAAVQSSPWLHQGSYRPITKQRPQNRRTKQKGERGSNPEREGVTRAAPDKQTKQIQRARAVDHRRQRSGRSLQYLNTHSATNEEITTPTQDPQSQETEPKPRTRETGGAAGAERKHQHRDNPTRRTEEREARRQHKTGGERAHENQRGCSSALTDVQWGSWIINDEYLSEEMLRTNPTHTQWCRGSRDPTQGNSL